MEIRIDGLTKAYGGRPVLRDFTHCFPDGQTTVIMGPSGCGKTTLLRLLLGLEPADSGSIVGLENARMSAVFQEDRLCENVSAGANLRLVNPLLSREDTDHLLRALGLGEALRQPVWEFSGGMKRRVAILRALIAESDVLFADEPFRGLDEETRRETMQFFREKTAGKTVLLVTHEEIDAAFFGGEPLRLEPAR